MADQHNNADGRVVFLPMLDRFARCIDDLRFFSIVSEAEYRLVVGILAFTRWKEVDWSCVDHEDQIFLSTGPH